MKDCISFCKIYKLIDKKEVEWKYKECDYFNHLPLNTYCLISNSSSNVTIVTKLDFKQHLILEFNSISFL